MLENISIDIVTVVVSALLLSFALATPWFNCFFRARKLSAGIQEVTEDPQPIEKNEGCPSLSIILTPHENAYELERNLPLLLNQDYPAPFEVIVVAWKGDSETEDVLKRYADEPHLYTTYVPSSSRYMSRKKLAITLGVKAAKNEWIMLTDIECQPASQQWLTLMAQHCNKERDMVIGYTAYDDETSDYRRFERLHTALYLLREDAKGTPYRHNGSNLLIRKSMFIDGDGFRGNLKFIRGEYDFIVNKYATRDNTALELHPDSWMIEQNPTNKSWLSKHLFYMESRRNLRRSWRHRLIYNIDQWAQHLNYLFILSSIIYSVLTEQWIITAAAALALILTLTLRIIIARRALTLFKEDISWWKIIPMEIGILWHHAGYLVRYHRADKNDFICHKI